MVGLGVRAAEKTKTTALIFDLSERATSDFLGIGKE